MELLNKEKTQEEILRGLRKGEGFPLIAVRCTDRYYHKDIQNKLFEKGFSWDGKQEVKTAADNGKFLTEFLISTADKNLTEYDNSKEDHPNVLTLNISLYSELDFLGGMIETFKEGEFIPKKTLIDSIPHPNELLEELEGDEEGNPASKTIMRMLRRSLTREGCLGLWNEKTIFSPFNHEDVGYVIENEDGETEEEVYRKAKFDALYKQLLNLVEENIEYFIANPKEMAYVFWRYDRALTAARYVDQGGDNPKYPIIDIEESAVEKGLCEDGIIYDAWGYSVSNESFPWDEDDITPVDYDDPFMQLQMKPEKTLEEWVTLLTDKRYQYSSIYPDKRRVWDHLLCTIGNGYGWDKNGFICDSGASGEDSTIYFDCYNHRPTGEVGEKLNEILNSETWVTLMDFVKECRGSFKKRKDFYKKEQEAQEAEELKEAQEAGFNSAHEHVMHKLSKINGKEPKEKKQYFNQDLLKDFEIPEEQPHVSLRLNRPWYPICNYSAICNYPENVHPSYLEAFEEIALSIIDNPRERASSIKEAEKVLKRMNVKFEKAIFNKTFKELHSKTTGEREFEKKDVVPYILDILASFGFDRVDHFQDFVAYREDSPYCVHFGFNEYITHRGFDYNCIQDGFWMSIDQRVENTEHPESMDYSGDFFIDEDEDGNEITDLFEIRKRKNEFAKLKGLDRYEDMPLYLNEHQSEWQEFSHGRGVNYIGEFGTTRNWGDYTTYNDSELMATAAEIGKVNFIGKYHNQTLLEFICRFFYDNEKPYFERISHIR